MSRAGPSQPLKYQLIKERLEHMIASLQEGDRLPPERALARDMGCSVLTVRSALGLLVEEGRITRCRGRGTFVGRGAPRMPGDRRCATGSERTLGVLIHAASDAFALRLNETVAAEAEARGVTLHARMVTDLGDGALRHVTALARHGCGAVVVPWVPAEHDDVIRSLAEHAPLPLSLPVRVPGLERHCFESPDVFGVNAARHVEALYDYFSALGHERIAFLGPDDPNAALLQRNLGAHAARSARAERDPLCGLVAPGGSAMDALAKRLARGKGTLAVICFDDEHALRFLTSMHKLGLSAPDDYAIAGFNDSSFAAHTDPPLSSMYQEGAHAAHWLIRNARALASGGSDQATEAATLRFAVRDTCGGRARLGSKLGRLLKRLGLAAPDGASTRAAVG